MHEQSTSYGLSWRVCGEAYPVAPNNTAEGRQRNRRVEVIILNEGQTAEDIRRQ